MNQGNRARAGRTSVAVMLGILTVVSLAAQGQPSASAARSWKAPRTPDGKPDLQGVWVNNDATPLERPPAIADKARLTDQEVAEMKSRAARMFGDAKSDFAPGDNAFLAALNDSETYKNPGKTIENALDMETREFDNRTSLIVSPADGKIPFTSGGGERQTTARDMRLRPAPTDPENLPNDLRCITFGVPRVGGNSAGYNAYHQIVQTSGYVVLHGELIHDARVIPLDGRPHLPTSVRLWNGDSRGRWEGETLVVDTTNFSRKSFFLGASENLHLVERFTRVTQDTIEYQITVSDPDTWTQPWTAVVHLKQTAAKVFEYACHEGNHQIMISMLEGAKAAK